MTQEERLDRGIKAERIINDPLYVDAYEQVKAAILSAWESAPVRDREGQHELKLMLKALADVRAVFERAITDGKIVADDLKRKSVYDKARRFMRI